MSRYGYVLGILLAVCLIGGQANAWVKSYQPFPKGEATIVKHRFCLSQDCGPLAEGFWSFIIEDAHNIWNGAGSDFRFYTRPDRDTDDPCNLPGEVVIMVSNDGSACPGDTFPDYGEIGGRTEFGAPNGEVRIYIRTTQGGSRTEDLIRLYLVHELGHVVGLDHPDEHGQTVSSVMNSTVLDLAGSDRCPLNSGRMTLMVFMPCMGDIRLSGYRETRPIPSMASPSHKAESVSYLDGHAKRTG